MRAAVIGSGFGGLSLAIRLQSAGIQTTVFEARDLEGGRAYVFKDKGYTFDAGPTVSCGRDNIRTVRDARALTVALADEVEAELPALISTDSIAAFRAVRAKADIEGDMVRLTAETAAALKIKAGATVRVKS